MRSHNELISDLVLGLKPVKPLSPFWERAGAWLLFAGVYTFAITRATGSFRPGAHQQFLDSARFLLENVAGVLGILSISVFCFSQMIPGIISKNAVRISLLLPVVLFVTSLLYGLVDPALVPSMVGKRSSCMSEVFYFSILPFLTLLWIARKSYPVNTAWTSATIGIAASLPAAVVMQVACMYDPKHNLLFHIGPAIASSLIFGMLSYFVLRHQIRKSLRT